MPPSLRPYQREAVDAVFNYWQRGGSNPVVEIPTGGGKSLVMAELARSLAQDHGARVVIAAHRKELIEQNAQAVRELWPDAPIGIMSASVGQKRIQQITVCGVQTAVRRIEAFGRVDVVLVDEVQMVSPAGGTMYRALLDGLRIANPEMRVAGLSATPYRLGQGVVTWGDDRIFDAIVYRAHMRDLVRDGYLAPLVTGKANAQIDTSGVGMSGGDFVLRDLELAANIDEITQTVAQDVATSGRRHCLVFGVSIAHAMALRDALLFAGVQCEVVSGETDKARRADIIARFQRGELRAIASCDILTVGFNSRNVDLIAVVRSTCSPGLWVQICGRGSRTLEGKTDCAVYDYGGNTARHGPVDDVVPPKARGPKKGDKAPCKSCPSCFAECPASARVCDHCDYEFPAPEKKANHQASSLAVMSTGEKQAPRMVTIERTAYARNKGKDGKPDTLRVEYYERESDVRAVCSEWVCLDHEEDSWPYRKAAQWWRARCKVPACSVTAALDLTSILPITTEITIEKDGKFWRVLSAKWRARTDADNVQPTTDSAWQDDATQDAPQQEDDSIFAAWDR